MTCGPVSEAEPALEPDWVKPDTVEPDSVELLEDTEEPTAPMLAAVVPGGVDIDKIPVD